jgi:N-acetylmuramoyl-L-alanine amidase CwlA
VNIITNSDGIYHVTFDTQKDTKGQVSLNTKDKAEAEVLVEKMRVKELESVSKVVDLTHQVVTQIVAGKNVLVPDAVKAWYEHVTGFQDSLPDHNL